MSKPFDVDDRMEISNAHNALSDAGAPAGTLPERIAALRAQVLAYEALVQAARNVVSGQYYMSGHSGIYVGRKEFNELNLAYDDYLVAKAALQQKAAK